MGMIKDEYVKLTCKPGQMENTCRYLLMGSEGWECCKTNLKAKHFIDKRVAKMSAKADNCDGV